MHGNLAMATKEQQDLNWYIVRCLRGTDEQAKKALENRGIETWYPKIVELKPLPMRELSASQRSSGVQIRRPVPSPLFPRYLFIRAELRDYDWDALFKESGVGGFTCEGNQPFRMRSTDLTEIRKRENGGMIDGKTSVRLLFSIGEKVTVTSGWAAGFPAIVERGLDIPISELDPETRIRLLVNIFGRETPSEFALWQVAKNE